MAETQEPDWTSVRRVVTATGSHVEPPLDVDSPELWQLRWLAGAVGDTIGITITVNEHPKVRGRYGLSYRFGNGSVGTALSHSSADIWAQLHGMESGCEIARAEIAALRRDLDAKTSDFDAACRHLGEARERIAELEADHARLVEDVASTVRRFSATLDERDALRARVTELEQAAALAAACRPPEIHDRPTDTDLAALVRALEGTGDPAYVLGAELTEKRARVAELEAERDRNAVDPEAVADEFGTQGLTVEDGVATLTTAPTTEEARDLVLAMSLALGKMLDDDQATNYVETEIKKAGRPAYVLNVRRAMGQTPHELRRAAEARVAELEAAQAEARRIHDESPGECYHCPRCQDADESQREAQQGEPMPGEYSERGFFRWAPVETTYGHKVSVYESSAASAPHMWLRILHGDDIAAHLTVDQARTVRDQISDWLERSAR